MFVEVDALHVKKRSDMVSYPPPDDRPTEHFGWWSGPAYSSLDHDSGVSISSSRSASQVLHKTVLKPKTKRSKLKKPRPPVKDKGRWRSRR